VDDHRPDALRGLAEVDDRGCPVRPGQGERVLRREAAASADFVIGLYNPASGRRTKQIVEAQRMIASDWLAVYRSRGLQPAP